MHPYKDQYPGCYQLRWLLVMKKNFYEGHRTFVMMTEEADEEWDGAPKIVGAALWELHRMETSSANQARRETLRSCELVLVILKKRSSPDRISRYLAALYGKSMVTSRVCLSRYPIYGTGLVKVLRKGS